MTSALTKRVIPSVSLRRAGPTVDLPAPFGPARATIFGGDELFMGRGTGHKS